MADFSLVEPFDIDNQELNGLSLQECFTIGVEWQMFRQRLLSTDQPFTELIHNINSARLTSMVERHGRFVECSPCAVGWDIIFVGDKI